MGRHAKGIEDTRDALIASATELFLREGYEAASVEAIIGMIGVSKGAFYHHFRSKEDMLDAVAGRMTAAFLASFAPIREDDGVPAVRKLDRFLGLLRAWRASHLDGLADMSRALYREENAVLRLKVNRGTLEAVQGPFAGVIRQGIAEGFFCVKDPEGTARLLLQLGTAAGEDAMALLLDAAPPDKEARVLGILELVLEAWERILGVPTGTLERPDAGIVRRFCAAFAGRGMGS